MSIANAARFGGMSAAAEPRGKEDIYKILATVPADQGKCPPIKN